MNPMEGMARQMNWVGRNTAHNLGFIPADKLNWKPAPTANSALEIIGHVVGFIKAMRPVLDGQPFAPRIERQRSPERLIDIPLRLLLVAGEVPDQNRLFPLEFRSNTHKMTSTQIL